MLLGRLFVFFIFYWPASAVPTTAEWLNLAHSVDRQLHGALPFASSCFSTVNGASSMPNETECTGVQAMYANATVQSKHFSTYMMLQWEMCQKTSEQCLLDSSNTSNLAAFADKVLFAVFNRLIYKALKMFRKLLNSPKPQAFTCQSKHLVMIIRAGQVYIARFHYGPDILVLKYLADFIPEGGNKSYRAISMGAGVPFKDVYEFADANNITIIGAYHQMVASSGGWVMGGGHSILTPIYSLGVDHVVRYSPLILSPN
ncbi:hypothetical protein IW262DRAFT_1531574 [Armillaria fumosa]|nr:hypothetical protein IW262DRAFT_1531574 [Armillaria fumosa]